MNHNTYSIKYHAVSYLCRCFGYNSVLDAPHFMTITIDLSYLDLKQGAPQFNIFIANAWGFQRLNMINSMFCTEEKPSVLKLKYSFLSCMIFFSDSKLHLLVNRMGVKGKVCKM